MLLDHQNMWHFILSQVLVPINHEYHFLIMIITIHVLVLRFGYSFQIHECATHMHVYIPILPVLCDQSSVHIHLATHIYLSSLEDSWVELFSISVKIVDHLIIVLILILHCITYLPCVGYSHCVSSSSSSSTIWYPCREGDTRLH